MVYETPHPCLATWTPGGFRTAWLPDSSDSEHLDIEATITKMRMEKDAIISEEEEDRKAEEEERQLNARMTRPS